MDEAALSQPLKFPGKEISGVSYDECLAGVAKDFR